MINITKFKLMFEIYFNFIYYLKKYIKIIFIISLIYIYCLIYYYNINNKIISVCMCTLGKEENKYIREFVEYYEKIGVDKIFLYDNNEPEKEYFDFVINDYIDKGFVKVFNWRGIKKPHFKAINDCYQRYNTQFNWLIFYDIDEFIHLYNYNNIKDFLNEKKFDNCQKIYLNWVFHTDNNKIYYENISLFKRFPEIERDAIINENFSQKVKSILRGNISNFLISNISHTSHIVTNSVKACNGFGKEIQLDEEYHLKPSDTKYYYIDHFYSKSLQEFIQKVKKGSAVKGNDKKFMLFRIFRYF